MLNESEYNRLYPYKELIRTIIINSSASNLPNGYKIAAEEIGKAHGVRISCSCSSGWFKITSTIYQWMLEYETNNQTDGKKEKGDRSSTKGHKRKP